MTPVVSLLVGVLVVLLITVATGYFVAQEFAYVAVDRSKLGSRAKAGDDRAARTLEITRRTSFMLSGAQLGITVTGLLVGYVAEPLIGQAIGSLLDGGALTAVSVAIGGFVAIGFSTFVQMLIGELFPKNYAIARSTVVADALTPSTRIYLAMFGPIIWVFDKAAELLLRALRIEPVHDVESAASATDLERVVAASRESGTLSPELAHILDRILDFPRRDLDHAMNPRVHVDVVRADATIGEVRNLMATGHTRYPVVDEHDSVIGVVQLADVLRTGRALDEPVLRIAREPFRLPDLTKLPDAENQLRAAGEQMACIIDEFGVFVGVVTLEDLAEEVIGELTDEHDPDNPDYLPQSDDGVWVMPGDVHVDEVERAIGLKLPGGDFETISGLIIHSLGDLPEEGAVVNLVLEPTAAQRAIDSHSPAHLVRIEVLAVERHVASRVRISLPELGEQK
ncbi:HlyC/CorC family transporter [Tessaracoccus sp. MC1865]|uniref:hemolysin family protein n=1 Tax=unclassified Tessaracoccus TaxID=2635419 RepID=UPI0015FFE179|nr:MULTISPECIES: hemolysin family protein [unclassified Tessaracoccus]MBB1482671.1 HlyC/CorC family transporter [Tessaracoccus sp. MC1865]MBB1509863.1 HlyC/CorC family transporter [Tessaracoccus sp. MC1756]QTO37880.1 HlyC/CorC family transporter [Tessaracoccus sp. MC1865]